MMNVKVKEAWEWLAGNHPAINEKTTASERVKQAEECLSSALNWSPSEPEAKLWASEEIDAIINFSAHIQRRLSTEPPTDVIIDRE